MKLPLDVYDSSSNVDIERWKEREAIVRDCAEVCSKLERNTGGVPVTAYTCRVAILTRYDLI